ncbi:MAG: hypothetical protein AMXMBFR84_24330 [Candidatus Hydrogenedentota bacterium]
MTFKVLADTELMLRVREDDQCAFEALYHRYHRRLTSFFYGMCSNTLQAEELSHETFARIWHLRQRYEATGSFTAYLFSCARNIWLERCREVRKQRRLGTVETLDEAAFELRTRKSFGPDSAANRAEVYANVREALDELPEEQRMVFVMRIVEGFSLEEIARIMQCPVNTVRSRKLLAVRKLRDALKNVFYPENSERLRYTS